MSSDTKVVLWVGALSGGAAFGIVMGIGGNPWIAGGVACIAVLAACGAAANALMRESDDPNP